MASSSSINYLKAPGLNQIDKGYKENEKNLKNAKQEFWDQKNKALTSIDGGIDGGYDSIRQANAHLLRLKRFRVEED